MFSSLNRDGYDFCCRRISTQQFVVPVQASCSVSTSRVVLPFILLCANLRIRQWLSKKLILFGSKRWCLPNFSKAQKAHEVWEETNFYLISLLLYAPLRYRCRAEACLPASVRPPCGRRWCRRPCWFGREFLPYSLPYSSFRQQFAHFASNIPCPLRPVRVALTPLWLAR